MRRNGERATGGDAHMSPGPDNVAAAMAGSGVGHPAGTVD